jgi:glycerol-3-phosphate acyltransferase PlsX
MRIAIDAYGSDNAPFPEVEGAIIAINEHLCDKIYLVGKPEELEKELAKYYYDKEKIEIVPASERITMEDKPASIVKKKKDSSLVVAVKLHKDGIVDGVVSAGNTGAVMAASLFIYGRIKNVLRPAIAITLPTQKQPEIILDVGANVDCNDEHLLQFAKLGSLYSRFFFGVNNPRVALLNIGEESSKGNDVSKTSYKNLSKCDDLNFIGNIEGKAVLKGDVDVIVCDGFVGNILLKTIEGTAISIFSMLKEQLKKNLLVKLGALLSLSAYTSLKKKLDHSEYGGALLVGLDGITIVSHGSSNAKAIKNAVRVSVKIAKSGFIQHAKEYFEEL